ncbi:MAG: sensor histidine kinase, partial [Chloroflexota bacterium]
LERKRMAEALRERVQDLEQANQTIRSFTTDLERRVREATGELAERVRELGESRGRLNAIIDSMQDGLVVYDAGGRVIVANPFVLSLFDLSAADLLGKTSAEVAALTGGSAVEVDEIARDGQHDPGSRIAELQTAGGRPRHVRQIVSPVVAGGSAGGVVVVYQDVTEQREIDQLKDDFLSIASHELKTPLTSILGYAQLLGRRLGGLPLKAGTDDMLSIIEVQSKRMKRLVDDLLDVSRIDRGAFAIPRRRIDLASVIRHAVRDMEPATALHSFVVTVPQEAVDVWGDEDRLDQVLTNLLSNAVKYSPDGGSVVVTLVVADRVAQVEVRDSGIGIPAEQIPRLFSRFYQAERGARSRRFGGLGLGLFITRGIVDDLGGTLGVESAPGRGSTFRFSLPLADGDAAAPGA